MNKHYLELVEEARRKKLILVDDCKQELSKLYLRAYKDINKKVFTKDSNIWAIQYRDELKKRTKELNPILYETVKNYAEKSADIGVYPEWALFSKILGDKDHEILNTLTRIPEEVVRELLNGDMYKDNQGLNKRIWRFQREHEQKIDYIIQKGLIEKKSTFELAKDLEMYVNPKAKKTFEWKKVYPNAGNKTIDFNAYRLASTSITHAYQMATIRAAQANPFSEGVKWHSVLSQRTCQLCKDRHGKVFKAEDVPLDHPLGLCTTYSVITKSLKEISEELKKEVYNIDKPNDSGYNNDVDNLHPKQVGGITRGKPMTFEEANFGRCNPNYSDDTTGISHSNCQSCVVAYEARRRGYDVIAKGIDWNKTSSSYRLATDARLAWIDPKTKTHPDFIFEDIKFTPIEYKKYLENTLEIGARYEMRFNWKNANSGHIVHIEKLENDVLRLYDPQSGKVYIDNKIGTILNRVSYFDETKKSKIFIDENGDIKKKFEKIITNTPPKLLKVSDYELNNDIIKDILTGEKQ